jgi:hypothetical protein
LPPKFFLDKNKEILFEKPEVFWLLGYFLGDGWVVEQKNKNSGKVSFSVEFVINRLCFPKFSNFYQFT